MVGAFPHLSQVLSVVRLSAACVVARSVTVFAFVVDCVEHGEDLPRLLGREHLGLLLRPRHVIYLTVFIN